MGLGLSILFIYPSLYSHTSNVEQEKSLSLHGIAHSTSDLKNIQNMRSPQIQYKFFTSSQNQNQNATYLKPHKEYPHNLVQSKKEKKWEQLGTNHEKDKHPPGGNQ